MNHTTTTARKPIGYNPKRHQLCARGYTQPQYEKDAYGCFNDAGALLGTRQTYIDAVALIDGTPSSLEGGAR